MMLKEGVRGVRWKGVTGNGKMEVSKRISPCLLVWVNESGVVRVYVCELNEKVSSSCCPVNVDYVVAA